MGGFEIRFSDTQRCLTLDDLLRPKQSHVITLQVMQFSDPSRSNTATFPSTADADSSFGTESHPDDSPSLSALLANVDEQDILDKSKTDSFSKGIALCQILWFLTACIARSIDHLPVTPLEIMTIAFATLNVIMYLIWWRKPLNVQRPIIIHASNLSDHLQPDQAELNKGSWKDKIVRMLMKSNLEAGELSLGYKWSATAVSTIMAMIFGAVHMAACIYKYVNAGACMTRLMLAWSRSDLQEG